MSRRIRLDDLLAPGVREHRGRLVDELAHRRLEVARRPAGGGLGAAALDQPQPQLGGERTGVVVGGGDAWLRRRRPRSLPAAAMLGP